MSRPPESPRRSRLARVGAVIVLVGALWFPTDAPAHPSHHPAAPNARAAVGRLLTPDVVLILTDDQRWDTLTLPDGTPVMPQVLTEIAGHGITFSNGFVVNSLCCPSRASILTGTYSHTNLTYTNEGAFGGYASFHDQSTVATWLRAGGYRAGLFGKYLNGYNSTVIPPGWSDWAAFYGVPNGGAYLDYTLNEDGSLVPYGTLPADYSTDVLAGKVDAFIRSTPPGEPLFAYFAPFGPHKPPVPAERDKTDFATIPPFRPPSYNEEKNGDKPRWLRRIPQLTPTKQNKLDELRKNQLRALESIDDAVGTIVRALSDTGRLSNTLIVFMSDNGFSWGEHRWQYKKTAYEENIRVPFIVRWDAVIGAPRSDPRFVTNIDLAPTFAEVGGVTPAAAVDGRSLVPLFTNQDPPWRSDFLIEHMQSTNGQDKVVTYCAVRNAAYVYTLLDTGEEELYDLAGARPDPYQLQNQAKNPAYAPVLEQMRAREAALCVPVPPGFDPPLP